MGTIKLLGAIVIMLSLIACGGDTGNYDDGAGSTQRDVATPSPGPAWSLTSAELCAMLSADEVSAVLGRPVTADADRYDGCHYEDAAVVARLTEITLASAEYAALMPELGAVLAESIATGEVLSFDAQGMVFDAWFMSGETALSLHVPDGITREQSIALIEAART